MMKFALNLPLNSVSFGQVSFGILKEIFNRNISPCLFPIADVDLSAYHIDQNLQAFIQSCINKSLLMHKRNDPAIKLWHLNGGIDSVSKDQYLFTFHETDQITDTELNVINNQKAVFVSSKFTKSVFEDAGAENVYYIPLGFDKDHFKQKDFNYLSGEAVVFSLIGKLEHRKNTLRIIKNWAERFGNDRRYRLNCLIFNPFIDPKQQEQIIAQTLGKPYYNITFLPRLRTNAEVNDFVNCADIDLSGLSGCEGFNLPCFNSIAMGKYAVVLDAHAHKDYANSKNAVLVEPSGMIPAQDGMFFHPGQPFNQGNWFQVDDDDMIQGMDKALELYQKNNVNKEGLKLQDDWTYAKTIDKILKVVR